MVVVSLVMDGFDKQDGFGDWDGIMSLTAPLLAWERRARNDVGSIVVGECGNCWIEWCRKIKK